MNKLIVLLVFFTSMTFGQKIEIGNQENQIKTYQYVLENFDLIKKNTPEEMISVNLFFNKYGFIQNAKYYPYNTVSDEEKKTEIQIPAELDEFIKNAFSFFHKYIFFSESHGDGGYSFLIPLDKTKLKNAIYGINEENKRLANEIDKIGIIPNSKFNLQIGALHFNRQKIESRKIESKLNELNSELIEIAPDLYLIFRVIKTNQFKTNFSKDYFEYKIMYLKGTSSKLYTSNRSEMFHKNEIEIDEIGSSGGNDNLADSNCFESDENSSDDSIFQNLKFNLKIQFTNSLK